MSAISEKFKIILDEVAETMSDLGFEQLAQADSSDDCVRFAGEKGVLKISCEDGRVLVYSGDDSEAPEDTPKRVMVSLLPDDASQKDIGYIVGEMKETLQDKFGKKAAVQKRQGSKSPQTVSKAAVKNGSFYDPLTLASKLCLVFPELRDVYKENIDEYGEFLAEEFFTKHATAKIINAVKENKPQTMKKLFQILNEIYEDGTNETQSLIAVTILGELDNDQILLARCVDYMSDTMAPPVIEVNKYLASGAGKKAKKKLLDPPPYKPKKEKKPGLLSSLMAGGGTMTPPVQ